MKTKILIPIIIGCIFPLSNFSQTFDFERILPPFFSDFIGAHQGCMAAADVDGDSDMDMIVSGTYKGAIKVTQLYINVGNGKFIEADSTPFPGVMFSSIDFADVDGDQDMDMILSGSPDAAYIQAVTKIYKNDGSGHFSEDTLNTFVQVANGAVSFADIDGDQDQDLLVIGNTVSSKESRLYQNDGQGNFTEIPGHPIPWAHVVTTDFVDIDGDQDLDLFITGRNINYQEISELYINDGNGNFSLVPNTPFPGVFYGAVGIIDIDGDQKMDIFLTGEDETETVIKKLYKNNGNLNFTEITNIPFKGVVGATASVADVDGDQDQDILIAGFTYEAPIGPWTGLYTNDGSGNFTLNNSPDFINYQSASSVFMDVDNDQDMDFFVGGVDTDYDSYTKLFINDGNGNFSHDLETPIVQDIEFGDIDGDQDLDFISSGFYDYDREFFIYSGVYKNDGNGNFEQSTGYPFDNTDLRQIAFGDLDGDSDLDLLICGYDELRPYPHIYADLYWNDGNGNFTLVPNTPFEGILWGEIAMEDLDNDQDLDVIIIGHGSGFKNETSEIYLNEGNGIFTKINHPIPELSYLPALSVADYDGDQDLDILVAGHYSGNGPITMLLENDGHANFTEVQGTSFVGIRQGDVDFADIDGDNDVDALISGEPPSSLGDWGNYLYINDGSGNFIEDTTFSAPGQFNSENAFADWDNDNDLDLILTGNRYSERFTEVYSNDGSGNFTKITQDILPQVTQSAIRFIDLDGDSDLDLCLTGGLYEPDEFLRQNVLAFYRNLATNNTNHTNELAKPSSTLSQNHPNPFRSQTMIPFTIEKTGNVQLVLYDLSGNEIAQLVNEKMVAGDHQILFDRTGLAQGIYIYALFHQGEVISKKMIVLD
ncbi:MAG: T9SS type A sorting domain-containing protein [Bacteroidetes bacterium]|nr:T9SS type A sorting domain-containing protein [Bacteroidota bacterium]